MTLDSHQCNFPALVINATKRCKNSKKRCKNKKNEKSPEIFLN
jgi:hypothetical protein